MNASKLGIFALALTSILLPAAAQAQAGDFGNFRVDCRYHNTENIEGIKFCYASATYRTEDDNAGGLAYRDVRFGVGCDQQTIFFDRGRIHVETTGERISPRTAAFPAAEIIPETATFSAPGTYQSVLDIAQGRLNGTCYVHRVSN